MAGVGRVVPVALHLCWQVTTLVPADGGNASGPLPVSNRFAGLLMFLACLVRRIDRLSRRRA